MLRALLIVGSALLCGATVGCLGVENALVYHPRAADDFEAPPPPPLQDLELTAADGTKIHARWAPYAGAKSAVLFCHGNGGNIEGWGGAVRDIHRQMQASVLIFDYPGYGRSSGKPNEAGCYAAAEEAYRWMTETQKIAPEAILLWGESLGGAVAIELASRKPHRALVVVRSFTSLPEVADDQLPLLPCSMMMNNRFDSLERIAKCQAPVFIASGDKDWVMQLRHGQRLHAACTAPAELCVLRGIGHNDPLPSGFYGALRAFLAAKAP